jgi:hypothetical protein
MSGPNLVNVWIYPYLPNEWRCQTFEGIAGIGRTRDEAKATFDRDWNQRAPYRLIEGHPPRPKRADDPKPVSAAIEGDSLAVVFHRALVKEFHSDRVGHRALSSDDILSVINRLWDEATAK